MEQLRKLKPETTLPLLLRRSSAFIIFIILLLFALLCWWATRETVKKEISSRLDHQSIEISNRFHVQFDKIQTALFNMRAHFKDTGIQNPSAFADFLKNSKTFESIPGLQALAFTKIYNEKTASILIEQQKKLRKSEFKIWPHSQENLKTSIVYIYPEDWRNKKALGYDMYSDPTRQDAMKKAIETGEVIMSQPVKLVQEGSSEKPQHGFLVYLPDYKQDRLEGFYYAVIRFGDFSSDTLNNFFSDQQILNLQIAIDDKKGEFSEVFLQTKSPKDFPQAVATNEKKLQIFDQSFKITTWYLKNDLSLIEKNAADFVLIFGLFITLLIIYVIYSYQKHVARENELFNKAYDYAQSAEAANMSKTAFLANMSHEIRTPLGAIMGYSEILSSPNTPANQKKTLVENIKKNGEVLTKLLEDILDSSKIEAGKLKVDKKPTNLQNLIHQVQSTMHVKANLKDIKLNFTQKGDLPSYVITDEVRVIQILTNLLNNAIRFTDEGAVNLTYGPFEQKGSKKIFFEIQDTGIGISKEAEKNLFKKFGQADVSTTRKYGGTGLGLSLSRNLGQLLGGDVFLVKSTPGKGSLFRAEIELIPDESASFKSNSKEEKNSLEALNLEGAHVLLVEDSPDNQDIFRFFLESAGATVDLAPNGQIASEKGLNPQYDVILMDIQIPYKDGRQVTRELRAAGVTKPIIALTAHAQREEVKACLEAGCTTHLAKPVQSEQLITCIHQLIHTIEKT